MRSKGKNRDGAGRGVHREITGRRFRVARDGQAAADGEPAVAPDSGRTDEGAPGAGDAGNAADEPVVRLETGGFDARGVHEPTEPAEPEVPKRVHRTHRATLGMAAAIVVLAVVAVIYVLATSGEAPVTAEEAALQLEVARDDGLPETAMEHFVAGIGGTTEQARAMLEDYYAGREVALRGEAGEVPAELRESMRPGGELMAVVDGDDDHPHLALVGRSEAMNRVRFVFVPVDDGLALDLRASFGIGELSLAELRELEPGREAEMRLVVAPANLYNSWFSDDEYASLRLSIRELDEPLWGYVRRDSECGRAILDLLDEDSLFFTEKNEVRLTLRLRRAGEGPRPMFEVVEVIDRDWVRS